MSIIEISVIEVCKQQYPEAVSEVEAVDLAAQEVYGVIIATGGTDFERNKYAYLNNLRRELNEKRIEELSSFSVN